MSDLEYQDSPTFVKVTPGPYANDKVVIAQEVVPSTFLQNTGFSRANFQDAIDSDAVCYPDPNSQFIIDNFNRLEGMFIIEPLYGASDDAAWYKVIKVNVNRDHLLNNEIDNIRLLLKKTRPVPGVS